MLRNPVHDPGIVLGVASLTAACQLAQLGGGPNSASVHDPGLCQTLTAVQPPKAVGGFLHRVEAKTSRMPPFWLHQLLLASRVASQS